MGKKSCKYIIECLLDIIFPQPIMCTNCNRILKDNNMYNLCSKCLSQIDFTLEEHSNFTINKEIYGNEIKIEFDEVIFPCLYKGIVRDMVHRLKYNDKRQIAITMAAMINGRIKLKDINFDYIVPVPISNKRLAERGYNQSEIIAEELSNLTGIKVQKCLKRNKDTKSQVLLNGYMRWYNVKDAFNCTVDLKGKDILILDDVITTGATMSFCAKALKEMGANKVIAAAFAG